MAFASLTAGPTARDGRVAVCCGAALGLAAFVYLLAWPPTLNVADESFTLYGAKRVYEGQALYRDFFDFIAPGSFYLYALAYAIGGVSIESARMTTALLHTVSVLATYALALHVASIAEAALAGLLVIVVCVPVYNLASHHWVATALGLATGAVLLARSWQRSTRLRPLAAGLLAGMLVCTHQGRGMGVIVWLAIVAPALAWRHGATEGWRRVARELAWTAGGGAIACVAILGWTVWRASIAEMVYATHDWVLTNYRSYHVGKTPWAGRGGFLAPVTLYTYWPLLRAEPALLAAEGALLAWTVGRRGVAAGRARAAVLLLALLAAASILYWPDFIHVAFVTPFVLVVLAGMAYRARTALPLLRTPPAAVGLMVVWLFAGATFLAKARANLGRVRMENPVRFATAFGTLAGGPTQPRVLADIREQLKLPPGARPRLFSYPTDAWIYLALPADNPTPFALLRPVYSTPEQLEDARRRLAAEPTASIVVNGIAIRENDWFFEWITQHYEDRAGLGPPAPNGFQAYRLFVPQRPDGG